MTGQPHHVRSAAPGGASLVVEEERVVAALVRLAPGLLALVAAAPAVLVLNRLEGSGMAAPGTLGVLMVGVLVYIALLFLPWGRLPREFFSGAYLDRGRGCGGRGGADRRRRQPVRGLFLPGRRLLRALLPDRRRARRHRRRRGALHRGHGGSGRIDVRGDAARRRLPMHHLERQPYHSADAASGASTPRRRGRRHGGATRERGVAPPRVRTRRAQLHRCGLGRR